MAVLVPFGAALVQHVLWKQIPPSPFLFFYPVVMVVAWYGGSWPGALALLVSSMLIAYRFLPPIFNLAVASAEDLLDLSIFAALSAVLIHLIASTKRERRRAEEERDKARRLTLLQKDILAFVSHDLKNPLQAISLTVASLQKRMSAEQPLDPEAMRGNLDLVRRAVHTAQRLITSVLDVARFEERGIEIRVASWDAREMVDTVVRRLLPIAAAHGVRVTVEQEAAAHARCDRERIEQALENLVSNALKFTPRGATVTVAIALGAGRVSFHIRDEGPGIAPDERAHLFDRYWRGSGRNVGSGLGLAIVKLILDAHGAPISVESGAERGTTFSFALPAGDASSDAGEEPPASETRGKSDPDAGARDDSARWRRGRRLRSRTRARDRAHADKRA